MKIYLNSCLDAEAMETQENDTILVQPIFLLFLNLNSRVTESCLG